MSIHLNRRSNLIKSHEVLECTTRYEQRVISINALIQPGLSPSYSSPFYLMAIFAKSQGPTQQLKISCEITKSPLAFLGSKVADDAENCILSFLRFDFHLSTTMHLFLLFLLAGVLPSSAIPSSPDLPEFTEAPAFRNGMECLRSDWPSLDKHSHSIIHVAMTLDVTYLRGSVAGVFSVLRHASCPENIVFHFIVTHHRVELHRVIASTFPYLNFHLYHFNSNVVKGKISNSIRRALDQPLNYARIYLADLLPANVRRIIYFDSDLIVVDDVAKLWNINLRSHVLGAPEYCHANFTSYFTHNFWSNSFFTSSIRRRSPCYFNTGVMVIDLWKWRQGKYTEKLEYWMRIQKEYRIYELGSLPPFLLVFGGNVKGVEHRWNQHGLGGDNLEGLCRNLHPGPVSLLHWSGKGKPWLRLDSKKPCPMDSLWEPYDLFRRSNFLSES